MEGKQVQVLMLRTKGQLEKAFLNKNRKLDEINKNYVIQYLILYE